VLALEPAGETVWAIAHHRLMTSSIPADRWHRVRTAPPVRGEVQGLVRFGADAGWLVWLDHVVPTRDGGRSWSQLPSPCNPADELEDMAAASSDVLWLYCGVFGAGSELASVYRSADGGRTWEVSVRPSNFGEGDAVDAASPEVLWVANGEGLVRVSDRGLVSRNLAGENGLDWGLQFVTAPIGWAWQRDTVYRTVDAGASWASLHMKPSMCGCIHRVGAP